VVKIVLAPTAGMYLSSSRNYQLLSRFQGREACATAVCRRSVATVRNHAVSNGTVSATTQEWDAQRLANARVVKTNRGRLCLSLHLRSWGSLRSRWSMWGGLLSLQ